MKSGRFGDFTGNKAHEVAVLFDYTFHNKLKWTLNAKYMNAPEANYVDFGGSNISEATAADALFTNDTGDTYTGLVEGRRTWLHFGKVQNALITSELNKQRGNHNLRLGLNDHGRAVQACHHSPDTRWIVLSQQLDKPDFHGYLYLQIEQHRPAERDQAGHHPIQNHPADLQHQDLRLDHLCRNQPVQRFPPARLVHLSEADL